MASKSFLQSKQWAAFQESLGRKVFWIDDILIIRMPLRLNKNYFYIPRSGDRVFAQDFLEKVGNIKTKDDIFLRVEPQTRKLDIEDSRFFKLTFSIQPNKTLALDLSKTEEQLLKEMHPKTRYNIRLAGRHGVKIKKGREHFESFWRLMQETARRDGIKIFPKSYYEKQLIITDNFRNELWVAEYERQIIAANLVNFYSGTATYLHGSSSGKNRQVMAPHLLQWEQIKEAKSRGMQNYDFWGFDEDKWPGVSRFKKGFGGEIVEYAGAYDLAWNGLWYRFYNLAKKFL